MTAWIDGSFIYSTSEAWLNAMRSFHNGTLLTEKDGKLPVRNTMRVPLFNNPVPSVMKMLSPERLFRKWTLSYISFSLYIIFPLIYLLSSWRSTHEPESSCPLIRHSLSALAQYAGPAHQAPASGLERRGHLSEGPAHGDSQPAECDCLRVPARLPGHLYATL